MEHFAKNASFSAESDQGTNTNRLSQYKKTGNRSSSQGERRILMLEMQKKNRQILIDEKRGLLPDNEVEEVAMETLDTCPNAAVLGMEDMDWKQKSYKIRHKKYANLLMLSEWLEEVPADLTSQWLFAFCPEGKRCLVVTSRGKTCVYSRSGSLVNTFPSLLPGGSYCTTQGNDCTMLDCIYSCTEKTYYILDILCWRNYAVTESEAEFRFYWLHTKVSEIPKLQNTSRVNPYKFVELGKLPCSEEALTMTIQSPLMFTSNLDGMLFFHKQAHYTRGVTPLVGWLKIFMVPEKLGITVPDIYMLQKPDDYVNMSLHLQATKKCNKKRVESMDV